MADRKKNRRKFEEQDDKPTKDDYAVAKFLRFKVQTKEAKLHNMEVQCFFASAAVDALMESKWSASKNAKEPLFSNRNSCIIFCQRLLDKGMFHRAERVLRKKDKGEKGETSKKKKSKEPSEKVKEEMATGEELRERKKKEKKGKKEKDDSASEKTTEVASKKEDKKEEDKKEEKKDEGKKRKEKRLKLIMTDDQRFLDGEENIYVWIYDPVNAKTLLIGSLIVLGAIALCLFPLWPEIVRVGVYYVSLAAAGFVGFILSLVVIRLILFCVIWLITLGRHHFWLLPNLTEDVGFFESFRPLYKHETVTPESAKDKDASSSSSKCAAKSSKKAASEKTAGSVATDKSTDKEASESEQDEFEMIDKGDVEEGAAGEGEGPEAEQLQQGQETGEGNEEAEGEEDEEEDEELNEEEDDAEEEGDHYGEEEELEEEPQNEEEKAENKKEK